MCPLPINRLAEHVNEIVQKYEWDNFQEEYGISWDRWLSETDRDLQPMLDRWWEKQSNDAKINWIRLYLGELKIEQNTLSFKIKQLDSILRQMESL